MLRNNLLIIFCVIVLGAGCRTVTSATSAQETSQEALSAVAGAVSGKPLSSEDLRNLEKQVREDEGARTAVQAISESVGGRAAVVKYCPVDGKRYASHMEICPDHQVPLEVLSP
jgi:hypothetical protein